MNPRTLEEQPLLAARAFVRGDLTIAGDPVEAVRRQLAHARPGWRSRILALYARFGPSHWLAQSHSLEKDARRLRFHYDRSNEFYKQFLDDNLVYSCAYFAYPDTGLEEAQKAKLDHVCRKLDLQPQEQLLDIGCGWGALLLHAARLYGVRATGCTVSPPQVEEARRRAAEQGLSERVHVLEADYRLVRGSFDKIVSVGMFEHVGPRALRSYFDTVLGLLAPNGLFLNHGIVRPQPEKDTAETLFQRGNVFPLGSLSHLSEVIRQAENAGFEILDVESLRPHYALTCRHWVRRLQERKEACLRFAGGETYRTWLLYLAASALYFETGSLDIHQILMARRGGAPHHWTRAYMYRR